jgi:hypothetical protein
VLKQRESDLAHVYLKLGQGREARLRPELSLRPPSNMKHEFKPYITPEYREAIHAEIERLQNLAGITDRYIARLNKQIKDPERSPEEVADDLQLRESAFEMMEEYRVWIVARWMQVQPPRVRERQPTLSRGGFFIHGQPAAILGRDGGNPVLRIGDEEYGWACASLKHRVEWAARKKRKLMDA